MGKPVNLNNILCKDCKRKRCICNSVEVLRQMYGDLKECDAKTAIGDAIDLIDDLKKIANKYGYYTKDKEVLENATH